MKPLVTMTAITPIDIEVSLDFIKNFEKQILDPLSKWCREPIEIQEQKYMSQLLDHLKDNTTKSTPSRQDPRPNDNKFLEYLTHQKRLSFYDPNNNPEKQSLLLLDQMVSTIIYPLFWEETPFLIESIKNRILDWRTISYPTLDLIIREYYLQFYQFWDNLKYYENPSFNNQKISISSFEEIIEKRFFPYQKYHKTYKEIYLMTLEVLVLSALARKTARNIPKISKDRDLFQDTLLLIKNLLPYPPFKPAEAFIDPYLIGIHFPSSDMVMKDYQIYRNHHLRRIV